MIAAVSILLAVVIVVLVIFAAVAMNGSDKQLDKVYYQKKWREIGDIFNTSNSGQRLAVIDADNLLDHALKQLGFSGETMGERLKSADRNLRNKQHVWQAHKLRNQLVHEQGIKLNSRQAKFALSAFEKALKGLGAL